MDLFFLGQVKALLEKAPPANFRSCFKPLGGAYQNVIVTKKLKSADGTATPTAKQGVADDVIRADDTIIVPITQFSFTPKQIRDRFDGDENFLLRGVVTHAAKNTINIKFDGDTHVSPYPKEGFGQFVKRRQLNAVKCSYFGTILIEEWNLNVITRRGWMEGDLMNFALSQHFLDERLPSICASVYLVQSAGNLELRVGIIVLNSFDVIVLYLHPLILLQNNLAEPLDKELNLLMMFPVCAGQHWSLLVLLVVKDLALYAIDSGRLKIFGHSDMQYAPAIGELEKILDLNRKQLTRSPTHLDCTIQPNTFDCGYHTVLNAFSLSDHAINAGTEDAEGNLIGNTDLTTWVPPTSTPAEIRQYRKRLYDTVAALPFAAVIPAEDDDPKICTDDDSDDEPLDLRT